MPRRPLLLATTLLAAAAILTLGNLRRDRRPLWAPSPAAEAQFIPLPTKARTRPAPLPSIASATVVDIDEEWGFVVLELQPGVVCIGKLPTTTVTAIDGKPVLLSAQADRPTLALPVTAGSTALAPGDEVLYHRDLHRPADQFYVDTHSIRWVSK